MRKITLEWTAAGRIFVLLAAAVLFPAAEARAQTLPLDDKARYEHALEQKVDEILLRMLGPNQAKVAVDAVMDFTRTEKLEIGGAEQSSAKAALFRWQDSGDESQDGPFLMPGYPVASPMNPAGASGESRSYQKQMLYPAAFVKKLTVTLILSREVGDAEAENIRAVVSELLGISPGRGDALVLVRAPFAPVWKTIWYTPEAVSLLFKYGVLSLMGLMALLVVAVGFLKLAGAMNSMAKAQQSHQITMDMGGEAGGGETPALGGPGGRLALAGPPAAPGDGSGEERPAAAETVFNVRAEQVPFLVNLMSREEPANVAIVTSHLPPEIRSEFLRTLPPGISAEVIASMARVRFLEPELIATLKDELERRLSGAVGGVDKVLEVLDKVGLDAKKAMMQALDKTHPEIAAEVRASVLLLEDLGGLPERDISLLLSAVRVEDLAAAAPEMPEGLLEKFRAQMAGKTWEMLEQTMKYGSPSAERTAAAVETLVGAAAGLVKEGRISDPLSSRRRMLTAPAGIAAPADAPPAGGEGL